LPDVGCSVESALRQMRDRGVRRLPVVDGQGRFVSVLSQDDVVDYLAEQFSMLAGAIRNEITAESSLRP
jgi:Mg/Co/Ni transporter MgtE